MPDQNDPSFSPQQIYESLQKSGAGREERIDKPYAPPPGRPQYDPSVAHLRYVPDEPTTDTLQLEEYEKKHLYDLAWKICGVFDPKMQPVPDAVYATMPYQQKAVLL